MKHRRGKARYQWKFLQRKCVWWLCDFCSSTKLRSSNLTEEQQTKTAASHSRESRGSGHEGCVLDNASHIQITDYHVRLHGWARKNHSHPASQRQVRKMVRYATASKLAWVRLSRQGTKDYPANFSLSFLPVDRGYNTRKGGGPEYTPFHDLRSAPELAFQFCNKFLILTWYNRFAHSKMFYPSPIIIWAIRN